MFPPADTELVCDGRAFADVSRPDLSRFPRFHEARRVEVEIHPGECFYLPPGWLHDVSTVGGTPSISLTHNFLDAASFKRLRSFYLMWKLGKVMGHAMDEPDA